MAELLKNFYNVAVLKRIAVGFSNQFPEKKEMEWVKEIMQKDWETLELKARIRRIAETLSNHLPKPFPKAVKPLLTISERLRKSFQDKESFFIIFLGDVVEISGLEYPNESLVCMEQITQIISCEFAIREFIIRHPETTWKKIKDWSKHTHPAVRRLASEGSRPRLPWGKGIPGLKQTPTKTIPILETLKNDPNEIVRRSVANHLNDISKDHPELVISVAKKWIGKSKETDALLKHSLRTLLKKGNAEVLSLFGFESVKTNITELELQPRKVKIGGSLFYRFQVKSNAKTSSKLRIEIRIHYAKPNGKTSAKVFQIEERNYTPGEIVTYNRKQSFQQMTTRTHFPGPHKIEILVNGEIKAEEKFNIIK